MKSSRKLECLLSGGISSAPPNEGYQIPKRYIGYHADFKKHLDNRARMKRIPISSKSCRK